MTQRLSDEELLFQRPWDKFADKFLAPDPRVDTSYLYARWIFLRALGLIFFSAFLSLAFQIHGLIGPNGIQPADAYMRLVERAYPTPARFWFAPSLFWIDASDRAMTAVVVCGMVASLLLTLNIWPRVTAGLSFLFFLSFVGVGQEFANYQSDGMLLEAGLLSIFFAPPGVYPKLGAHHPPSRISLFLLRWEWFKIYFESGVVKLASGDPHWRNFTAMDNYYENGPLPTWIGWYAQHLPHGFHAVTVFFTLFAELALVWLMFFPRKYKLILFAIVTPMQIGIILTANYAFLNYIVLLLGVLLVDDRAVARLLKRATPAIAPRPIPKWRRWLHGATLASLVYASVVAFFGPRSFGSILAVPDTLLAPFRVANAYGLFAVMTPHRYEIEFQGSRDGGATWTPYRFKFKPQAIDEAPGIYAPYQPRFEWDLWFASLGSWTSNEWVVQTEMLLLDGDPAVVALFREDPFGGVPPTQVRAVKWQYWFTDSATKRATGAWWRREDLGLYGPIVERTADGAFRFTGP